jgi:DNA-binding MarR family transcriptional regulator
MLRLARVTPATVAVLRALLEAEEPSWGLRVVGETGRPAGSVYPILARLEDGGWVTSQWDEAVERGPRRRLYELTADGRVSALDLVARADRAAVGVARPAGVEGARFA